MGAHEPKPSLDTPLPFLILSSFLISVLHFLGVQSRDKFWSFRYESKNAFPFLFSLCSGAVHIHIGYGGCEWHLVVK